MAYNGWSNYETWNLALWIDNDHSLYSMRSEEVERIVAANDDRDDAERKVAAWLESIVDDGLLGEMPANGFLADILTMALREVDYREIADTYVSDIWDDLHAEEEEEEDTNVIEDK